MKTKIINYLEKQLEDEIRICGKYTDSGDIGVCVQHRVEPLKVMIGFMQEEEMVGNHNVIFGDKPEMLSEL